MLPVFEHVDAIPTFLDFIKNDRENIAARVSRYQEDKWEIATSAINLTWPKSGTLYPEHPPIVP